MAKADYGLDYLKIAPSTEVDRSGYYQCPSTTPNALQVVADSTTNPDTDEIKIGAVTPYMSTKTLEVGDYVVNVSLPVGSYIDFASIVGLPTFNVSAIVKDSFVYGDTAPTEENIEIEDSDDPFAVLKTDGGEKSFTVETYDMSAEAYAYLMGYAENNGWQEEAISFDLPNQCVEFKTRKLGGHPAKIYQFARMSVTVTRTGQVGKSDLPRFQMKFTKLANYNASGEEIRGSRWKEVTA